MRPAYSVAIQVIGSIAILVVGFLGFQGLMRLKPEPEQAPSKNSVPSVGVAVADAHTAGVQIEVDGVVVPYRVIPVAAEVAGRIKLKNEACRAGHFVKKGAVLAEIDDYDYQLEVDRIQKELDQAEVSITEVLEDVKGKRAVAALNKREFELAEREWKRQEKLGRDVVSTSNLDKLERTKLTAELAYARTKNQITLLEKSEKRLKAAMELAEKRLKRAQKDLERTKIKAPIDGVIIKDDIEQDAYTQRGTVLFNIEDTSRVEVRCNLQMDDLYWIWQSTNTAKRDVKGDYQLPRIENVDVAYRFAGRGTRRYVWRGRLDRFDGLGLDEQTRTAPCRVVVENPRGVAVKDGGKNRAMKKTTKGSQTAQLPKSGPPALVRGMFVSVQIRVHPKNIQILRVPETAMRPGKVMWKVDRTEKLAIHPVRFIQVWNRLRNGGYDSNLSEILFVSEDGSVKPGDRLVTSPLAFVKSGMAVKVSK